MIRYKAEEYGIQVIVREERYTSRQSALDFDQLPNYGDKNANLVPSSGKRIGGLFIRSNGQKINADVNGCLNIGRKELGDGWLKKLGGLFDAARYCPYRVVTRMGVPPPTPRRSPPRGSGKRRALTPLLSPNHRLFALNHLVNLLSRHMLGLTTCAIPRQLDDSIPRENYPHESAKGQKMVMGSLGLRFRLVNYKRHRPRIVRSDGMGMPLRSTWPVANSGPICRFPEDSYSECTGHRL